VISCSAYAADAAKEDQQPCTNRADMQVVGKVVDCKAWPELLSIHTLLDRELQLPAWQPNTAQDAFFYKT